MKFELNKTYEVLSILSDAEHLLKNVFQSLKILIVHSKRQIVYQFFTCYPARVEVSLWIEFANQPGLISAASVGLHCVLVVRRKTHLSRLCPSFSSKENGMHLETNIITICLF